MELMTNEMQQEIVFKMCFPVAFCYIEIFYMQSYLVALVNISIAFVWIGIYCMCCHLIYIHHYPCTYIIFALIAMSAIAGSS